MAPIAQPVSEDEQHGKARSSGGGGGVGGKEPITSRQSNPAKVQLATAMSMVSK